MFKKIIFFVLIAFLIVSCADLRRGLTGSKQKATDEFLVKKKDPLILPPDFENLPMPLEREQASREVLDLRKSLGAASSSTESFSKSGSIEESILQKIKNN